MANFNGFESIKFPAEQLTSKELAKQSKESAKKKEQDDKINRREFLSSAVKLAVGATVAGGLIKEFYNLQQKESTESQKFTQPAKIEVENKQPTQEINREIGEPYNLREAEGQSIRKLTDYDKPGRIELSSKTQIEHWKNEYKNNPKLKDSLTAGYYKIGEWETRLRKIFIKENVPEKYIYIALGESHWQIKAVSPAKATGPFQFMYGTAVKEPCSLEINDFVDKRFDPLASAEACAKLLKDNWSKLNQDWNLALAAYNGSFVWKFKSYALKNNIDVSYDNYLEYMEERINKKRDEIKNLGSFRYPIGKSETLEKIAEKFGTTASQLADYNHLKLSHKIKRGQKIHIPYNEKIKKMMYGKEMKGWHENLTYPEKFNAIVELINEKFVTKQSDSLIFKEISVKEKIQKTDTYHVRRKENINQIAGRFKIDLSKILLLNPNIDKRNRRWPLKSGMSIKLPIVRQRTLVEYANRHHLNLKYLADLNPAILDYNKPIPEGFELRV